MAARLVVGGSREPSTWVLTAGTALSVSLLRTEKAAVLIAFAAALTAVLVVARLRSPRARSTASGDSGVGTLSAVSGPRLALCLTLVLVLPAALAVGVNRATQTADEGRTTGGLVTSAMSRVVWPHLAEVYDDLDDDTREAVTLEEARAFDDHNNNALPMTARLRNLDGGGDAYTTDAIRAVLSCCWLEVTYATLGDASEYAVTPFTFAAEGSHTLITADPEDTPTAWNISRMEEHSPRLTRAFLGTGFLTLAILLVAGLGNWWSGRRMPANRRASAFAGTVALGTTINGFVFAAAQGADANARYGLGTAVALLAFLVIWTFSPPTERT